MNQRSARSLYRWHRRAGVTAAAVLVYLLATGLPLQFSGALQLGSRHVDWQPLLDWYGLQAPDVVLSSGGLTAVGDEIFRPDGHLLRLAGFKGAVRTKGLLAVAGRSEVVLLEPDGLALVDRWSLPANAEAIGTWQGRLVLQTSEAYLLADENLANWQKENSPPVGTTWAPLRHLDPLQAAPFRMLYRGRMLSLERALQDLHSGRLFGRTGVLVLDVASALLLFLAASGLVMWARYSTSSRRR